MDKPKPEKIPLIVSYNLHSEEHHLVPHPDHTKGFNTLIISDFDGYLCITVNYTAVKADVWVMKEYMVKESWVKMFTVRQDELAAPLEYFRPVGCLRDGNNVLLVKDSTSLVMYNLKRKTGVFVDVLGMQDGLFDVTVCLRSLVSLDGGGGIEDSINQEHIEGTRKKKPQKKRDDFLSKGFKLKL